MLVPFDLAVARAVAEIKQVERALHDGGTWTFGYRGQELPATREVTNHGVIFSCAIPSGEGSTLLELRCDGEPVAVRLLVGMDQPSLLEWEMSLSSAVSTSA